MILLSDIHIMSNLVLIKLRNSLSLSMCRAGEDIFSCMTVRSLIDHDFVEVINVIVVTAYGIF